jgi:hypothetical protein
MRQTPGAFVTASFDNPDGLPACEWILVLKAGVDNGKWYLRVLMILDHFTALEIDGKQVYKGYASSGIGSPGGLLDDLTCRACMRIYTLARNFLVSFYLQGKPG